VPALPPWGPALRKVGVKEVRGEEGGYYYKLGIGCGGNGRAHEPPPEMHATRLLLILCVAWVPAYEAVEAGKPLEGGRYGREGGREGKGGGKGRGRERADRTRFDHQGNPGRGLSGRKLIGDEDGIFFFTGVTLKGGERLREGERLTERD